MNFQMIGQSALANACYSLCYSPHFANQLATVSCENYGIRGRSFIQIFSGQDQYSFVWPEPQYDVSFVETDPSLIISAVADGSILIWQLNSNTNKPLVNLREHNREVWCVHWSESRSTDSLLSTSADGTIKLWNFTSSPKVDRTIDGRGTIIYEARWHPRRSGIFGAVSSDGSLTVFDLHQTSPVMNLRAHTTEILSIDWSKYDDYVLATAACDNCIRLWDIRMLNKSLVLLTGHTAAVRRVRFDPYKRDRLASSGYDGHLNIWNLTSNYSPRSTLNQSITKEFIYGLDWNLFERDQIAIGSWDRYIRFCQVQQA